MLLFQSYNQKMQRDPTQRFSDRVENYVKHRPGYPAALYDYLRAEAGLPAGGRLADIGSGTGLLSELFLTRGHEVLAVEPNAEMRSAADILLGKQPGFVSLDGTAEAIPLADASVDLLVAGQAFHWFDPPVARREFGRVLKSGGHAALIWNMRDIERSPFQHAYEDLLLEFGTDFKEVDHQRKVSDEGIAAFFAPQKMRQASFPNRQVLDEEGLRGRLMSSSYAPQAGQGGHEQMMARLGDIFASHQKDGHVNFDYQCVVYHAPMLT
jgi:SAM-dependent methyltransferase